MVKPAYSPTTQALLVMFNETTQIGTAYWMTQDSAAAIWRTRNDPHGDIPAFFTGGIFLRMDEAERAGWILTQREGIYDAVKRT